ncbi:MAG: FAD-dependent oxidoreductase, partial [Planctomycetes bacterium]|nr:FAD-dependent oxidoreductase [Planctomycetota bacterium]
MSKSFFFVLRQLAAPAGEPESALPARAARKIGCAPEDILSWRVIRKSLDARKRRKQPTAIYHLRLEMTEKWRKPLRQADHLDIVFEPRYLTPSESGGDPAMPDATARPLVVGAGPAGLFAALRLARAGWRPLLIERGDAVPARRRLVADFWRSGKLDPESNVLFGVGGAGLFSDGKLNTRHKDRHGLGEILDILIKAGAPESIRIEAEPHVGSDLLCDVVERLANEILDRGGEIRYRAKLTALHVDSAGGLCGATVAAEDGEYSIETRACILAVGNSARDVFEMLARMDAAVGAHPFAVGVRVAMPEEGIDASQRDGSFKPAAGQAASFRLSRRPEGIERPCYTFCMCPGGLVIPCASEPGRLAVNGMSYHARAGEFGNAAFLVPVTDDDFAGFQTGVDNSIYSPLAGVNFQRRLEEAAFEAGKSGGDYAVPASTLDAFVRKELAALPERRGVSRTAPADLHACLPETVAATLAKSIPAMLGRLRRVDLRDVILYGVEPRTSRPVRIKRDDSGDSSRIGGIY